MEEQISLQISLKRNSSNSLYIFILSINFKNLIGRLNILIISFMFVKFQEYKKSIAMSSKNVKILSFCNLNLCIKNNLIARIVNNI